MKPPLPEIVPRRSRPRLIKANEAAVYGALLAGCRSFYGYPITPASELAETAARLFPACGGTFLQAESEIAAVNMLYGASSAGERTMSGSSGPGISLMMEGISYVGAGDGRSDRPGLRAGRRAESRRREAGMIIGVAAERTRGESSRSSPPVRVS